MAKTIAHSTFAFPSPMPLSGDVDVKITRDDITLLLMESHKKCENASEEVAVLREVAKLNDLYPSATQRIEVNHTHVEHKKRDLEKLSTEELLRMAGESMDLLTLPEPIEGEYVEVEEVEEEKDIQGTAGNTNDVMPITDV